MSDGANRSAAPAEWTFSEDPNQKPRESCVKHFDALWFCYCEHVMVLPNEAVADASVTTA